MRIIIFLMIKFIFLMRTIVFMMMKIATICRFDFLIGTISVLSQKWMVGECWIAGCKTTSSNKEGIKVFSIAEDLVQQRKN